jgi:L-asparaginase
MKILVIGLGGNIGSVKSNDSIGLDSNNLKILACCKRTDVELIGVSPFSVLSENMSISLFKDLIDYLNNVDFINYDGVIILHGSDTLAFTSSIIANAFANEKIIFVAADKPIEDKSSNGIANFNNAIDVILSGKISNPLVSYNGIFNADCITSANIHDEFISLNHRLKPINSKVIYDKNILIVNPYVSINYDNYNLDNVDAVLITMYHSATVASNTIDFCKKLKSLDIKYNFVTHRQSADYETASCLDNIIFNCTIENAYARMLLTK